MGKAGSGSLAPGLSKTKTGRFLPGEVRDVLTLMRIPLPRRYRAESSV